MDWAKAKTILIVVFLAINIFLGYMIIGAGNGSIGYVDSQKIQEAVNYLAEKKIQVTGEVPSRKTDLPSITVKYKLFRKEDIAGLFPSGDKLDETKKENILTLKSKDIKIEIKDDREFYYQSYAVKPAVHAIDEKASRQNINEFLVKLGIKPGEMMLKSIEEAAGYRRYVYTQEYRKYAIYNSMMEFYVNENGVHKARIVWFDTVKQTSNGGKVVSSLDALSTMFDYCKEDIGAGFSVSGIEQGYYFGIGANEQVDTSKIEEGTAFPVWKITTDRNQLYVNAYNNKIEGVEGNHRVP